MKWNWVNVESLLQAAPEAKKRETWLNRECTYLHSIQMRIPSWMWAVACLLSSQATGMRMCALLSADQLTVHERRERQWESQFFELQNIGWFFWSLYTCCHCYYLLFWYPFHNKKKKIQAHAKNFISLATRTFPSPIHKFSPSWLPILFYSSALLQSEEAYLSRCSLSHRSDFFFCSNAWKAPSIAITLNIRSWSILNSSAII